MQIGFRALSRDEAQYLFWDDLVAGKKASRIFAGQEKIPRTAVVSSSVATCLSIADAGGPVFTAGTTERMSSTFKACPMGLIASQTARNSATGSAIR